MDPGGPSSESFLDLLENPFLEDSSVTADLSQLELTAEDATGVGAEWETYGDEYGGEEDAEGDSDDAEGELEYEEYQEYQEEDDRTLLEGDEEEQIPADIGRQMDEATADIGGTFRAKHHTEILWEDEEDFMMELDDSMGQNVPGRKRRRKRGYRKPKSDLSPELEEMLGQANVAYTMGEYPQAVSLLHEIIQQCPNSHQAWSTLAMVHDETGDPQKALQTYLMAAHISPKDAELWRRLGGMSKKLGYIDQAIYCYSHAIKADSTDSDSIWERAMCYNDKQLPTKAVSELETLLQMDPENMEIVKELAKIYWQLSEIPKAIQWFEKPMRLDAVEPLDQEDVDAAGEDDEEVVGIGLGAKPAVRCRVGYEEVNMLAELYIKNEQYEEALRAITVVVRRTEGRPNDDQWDEYDDDREFDEGNPGAGIPLELRKHFRWLFNERVGDYGEAYFDVGEAFLSKGMYSEALKVFETLYGNSQEVNIHIWSKLGESHHHLGNLEEAAELYESVLDALAADESVVQEGAPFNESDREKVKLGLAKVYQDMGRDDEVAELLAEVDQGAQQHLLLGDTGAANAEDDEAQQDGATAGELMQDRPPKNAPKKDRAIVVAEEKERARENKRWYQACCASFKQARHDKVARTEYFMQSRKLLDRFRNNRKFYPSERSHVYKGQEVDRRKKRAEDVNEDAQIERPPVPQTTEFQGLSFEEWYDAFLKFAVLATMDGREDEAQEALEKAFEANVFYHDVEKRVHLKFHMMASAIYAGNAPAVTELCRWFCNYKPMTNDAYRLYSAMHSGGSEAVASYADAKMQKYFLRQIRLMEAGMKQSPNDPSYKNATILSVYGHILLAARSYLAALTYYIRAFRIAPDDPLINFALGVTHIHRAMQRKSDNRHRHIMQGVTFMLRYHELVGGTSEADYNLGRMFHQIGLNHMAVNYYEKVIAAHEKKGAASSLKKKKKKAGEGGNGGREFDESNLVRETAYNLHLLYVANGSFGLAQVMLRDYCSI
ncbi:transcription factor TFIIIC subunit tfc4 [Rhizophlyctis rosea]|nr:transcription factor TFIIIC subunit tfc4 [Rhizophlyctis rosea]